MKGGLLNEALKVYELMQRVIAQVSQWKDPVPLHTCVDNIDMQTTLIKNFMRNTQFMQRLQPTTYMIIYMSYTDYMSIDSVDVAERLLQKSAIIVSKDFFDEVCQNDIGHATSMRELIKSENRDEPTRVIGITKVFCTPDLDVRKSLFAIRTEEDMTRFDFEAFKRMTLQKFPGMSNKQLSEMWRIVEQTRKDPNFYRAIFGDNYQVPEEFVQDVNLSMRTCFNCNRRNIKLDMCSGCNNAWYCNRECQCMHWKEHKKICFQSKK